MDTQAKEKFREIVREKPLWGECVDAMSKVLFPKSVNPKIGIAKHARFLLWSLVNYDKLVIQLPRYHGKSTYVTFVYVMWCILTRQKKFILIISSTGNQAVKFLTRIKHYLTSRKVKFYYGDLDASNAVLDTENESFDYVDAAGGKKRSQLWNFKEILIEAWGIRIMATSIGAANRGLLNIDDRPDLIILDDIEDRKNTNTPELRDRLSNTIVEEIFPAGRVDCQFVVVGTICHYGSFLLRLRKLDNWFFVPLTRATDTIENIKEINKLLPKEFPKEYRFDPKPERFKNNTIGIDNKRYKAGDIAPEVAVWQEMYSYEYFCGKYTEYNALGKVPSFWQEFYNIPKTSEQRVFNEFKYIQDVKFKWFLEEPVLESTGEFIFPNNKKIINVYSFLGGDLAVSEREGADWRVFITVFTDPFYNVYVLPPYKTKEPDPFIIGKWVLDNNINYEYKSATFDGQHFQKWFGNILQHIEKTDSAYRKARLRKVHQKSRTDKKEDVITATISPIVGGGRLYLVGDPNDFSLLVKELVELGYCDHDDHADGLAFACSNLKYPDEINFDRIKPVNPSVKTNWIEKNGIPIEEVWKYA